MPSPAKGADIVAVKLRTFTETRKFPRRYFYYYIQGVFVSASIFRKILEYSPHNTGVFWAQYWSILGTILSTYYEGDCLKQWKRQNDTFTMVVLFIVFQLFKVGCRNKTCAIMVAKS